MSPSPEDMVQRLLHKLFPFNIVVDLSSPVTITSVGSSLSAWIGPVASGTRFDERVAIVRPSLSDLTAEVLKQLQSEVFILKLNDNQHQMRGQFVLIDSKCAVFAGSPVANIGISIDELGLVMADFAPHDPTPDSLVLGRFSKMQIDDLERQTNELRKAHEQRDTYSKWASTDELTGLANRRGFWEQCESHLARACAESKMALLYIDVDGFKAINDEHGHLAGDNVLKETARRLSTTLRSGDISARLGGDEFAALLLDVNEEVKEATVERIKTAMERPITFEEQSLDMSVSVGVRLVTAAMSLDDVVRDADTAMYGGRTAGGGHTTWFRPQMGIERNDRRALTSHLKACLDAGRVQAMFQPIVRLADQKLVAVESLARWNHPQRGPIGPDLFVGLAERAGFVDQLDDIIMRFSLEHLAAWHVAEPGLGLHVNISGRSIDKTLPSRVRLALDANGVHASSLTIEVTEGWFIDGDDALGVLNEIVAMGVQVQLDDFGTGFSSMAHLQGFPISGLKIDRSFVAEMATSARSYKLVAATISMAQSLGFKVVAEGVESESQATMLKNLGCEYAQGYLFATPLSASDTIALIKSTLFPQMTSRELR